MRPLEAIVSLGHFPSDEFVRDMLQPGELVSYGSATVPGIVDLLPFDVSGHVPHLVAEMNWSSHAREVQDNIVFATALYPPLNQLGRLVEVATSKEGMPTSHASAIASLVDTSKFLRGDYLRHFTMAVSDWTHSAQSVVASIAESRFAKHNPTPFDLFAAANLLQLYADKAGIDAAREIVWPQGFGLAPNNPACVPAQLIARTAQTGVAPDWNHLAREFSDMRDTMIGEWLQSPKLDMVMGESLAHLTKMYVHAFGDVMMMERHIDNLASGQIQLTPTVGYYAARLITLLPDIARQEHTPLILNFMHSNDDERYYDVFSIADSIVNAAPSRPHADGSMQSVGDANQTTEPTSVDETVQDAPSPADQYSAIATIAGKPYEQRRVGALLDAITGAVEHGAEVNDLKQVPGVMRWLAESFKAHEVYGDHGKQMQYANVDLAMRLANSLNLRPKAAMVEKLVGELTDVFGDYKPHHMSARAYEQELQASAEGLGAIDKHFPDNVHQGLASELQIVAHYVDARMAGPVKARSRYGPQPPSSITALRYLSMLAVQWDEVHDTPALQALPAELQPKVEQWYVKIPERLTGFRPQHSAEIEADFNQGRQIFLK